MKKTMKTNFITGLILFAFFVLWTILVSTCDLQPVGVNGSNVGFAGINTWFHNLTGVRMTVYNITDWLGIVPFLICAFFGCVGLKQWTERKNILKVDADIIILGIYYIIVIAAYFFFEAFPINYRPVLIEGCMEASYPSSTTLLVMTVLPTLTFQAGKRIKNKKACHIVSFLSGLFAGLMLVARLMCGVHWLTDVMGGVILSIALYNLYLAAVKRYTSF